MFDKMKITKLPNGVELHEYPNGDKLWYLNGEYHREDGPAIEFIGGDKYWYINGKYHRIDGPAIEWANGNKFWYINGKRHREDGPAVEYADGIKLWYINDIQLNCTTQKQFLQLMRLKAFW